MGAHQAPPSLGFSRQEPGVGCHFLLQCMKVKSESEVAQLFPTLSDPMDCNLPGSSVHGFSRQEYWSGVPLPSPIQHLLAPVFHNGKHPSMAFSLFFLEFILPSVSDNGVEMFRSFMGYHLTALFWADERLEPSVSILSFGVRECQRDRSQRSNDKMMWEFATF